VKRSRLAAIDIGTNSIRCIVVDVGNDGKFRVLDDEKVTVRLGERFAKHGAISEAAWRRAMDALSRMKKIVDSFGVVGVETVATSAVRRAANGEAFVQAVATEIGLQVAVISGEDEAQLAAASALHNFDMEGSRYAMVDIGGSSVEIVTALGSHIEEVYSLELGAVTLSEKYVNSDPLKRGDYLRLRRHIRRALREVFTGDEVAVQCLLGSSGTMTEPISCKHHCNTKVACGPKGWGRRATAA
jgi:exopolyphosphatase / guanosine-5'-triphosphate,3'-diphosphate pyrophosphatase